MRYGILLVAALAVAIPTAADAKRNKGTELAKLRAQIADLRRDLLAMQVKLSVTAHPSILGLLTQYPPAGVAKVDWPVGPVPTPLPGDKPEVKTLQTYRDSLPGVSMAKAPAELQEWMRKVADRCEGFKAISVCRPGARVAGSGRISLHASCRAVDFQVKDYGCAQKALKDFPGGLSTDPYRVRHLHASWAPNAREWHARFVHGGGRSYHVKRYAKKRYRTRYAYYRRHGG